MKFQDAVRILREGGTMVDEKGLYNRGHYIAFNMGKKRVVLDDDFEVEELKAIVVFIETIEANPKALQELDGGL